MPTNNRDSSSQEDQFIKDLVQNDHSMPSAPKDEWQKISRHLHNNEKKGNSWFWRSGPLLIATMAVLLVIMLPEQNKYLSSKLSAREVEEIARYLMDTNLPHEEEQANFIAFDSL